MLRKSQSVHLHLAGISPAISAIVLVFFFYLLCTAQPAPAAVVATGDVDPADPTTWTSDTTAYIGNNGNGTLSITNDGDVSAYHGYIGYESGSSGEVTVAGVGSTWTNSDHLHIGHSGNGSLNITEGAAVRNSWGIIGITSGSTGEVTVNGAGSTWNNNGSLIVGSSGSGTLNIINDSVVTAEGYTILDLVQ